MRFVRYKYLDHPIKTGWVFEDKVGPVDGDIFGEFRRLEAQVPLTRIRFFPPVLPSKIIGVEHNFLTPGRDVDQPPISQFYLKPPSALVGSGEKLFLPLQVKQMEAETHLAIIIGKVARKIRSDQARDFIFGYTVAIELVARNLLQEGKDQVQSRGMDATLSLGPWIETDLNPADVLINCRVNGELRQMASTRELKIPVEGIVGYLSTIMSLFPGDVILAGSPAGARAINPGDRIVSSVEGIGDLINLAEIA